MDTRNLFILLLIFQYFNQILNSKSNSIHEIVELNVYDPKKNYENLMRKLTNDLYEYKFTAFRKLFHINVKKVNKTKNYEFPFVTGYLNEPKNHIKGNLIKEIFVGKVNLDGKEYKISILDDNQIKPKIMITENIYEYNATEKLEFKKHLQALEDDRYENRKNSDILISRNLWVWIHCSESFISRYDGVLQATLKVHSLFASFNRIIVEADFNKDGYPDKFNVMIFERCTGFYYYEDDIKTRNFKDYINEIIRTKPSEEFNPLEVYFTDTEFDAMGYAEVGIACASEFKRNAIGFSTFGVDESFRQDYFFAHYMSTALGASSDSFNCAPETVHTDSHNEISVSDKNFDTVDLTHIVSFYLSDCAIQKILDSINNRLPADKYRYTTIGRKCISNRYFKHYSCGNFIVEGNEECDCGRLEQTCGPADVCCNGKCERTSPFCIPSQHEKKYFPTVNPIVNVPTTPRTYTEYIHPDEYSKAWIYILVIVIVLAILAAIFVLVWHFYKK